MSEIPDVGRLVKHSPWRVLGGLAALGAAVAVFIKAVALSRSAGFGEIEESILQAFRQAEDPTQVIGPDWLHGAAIDFTALGGTPVVTLIAMLVVGYCLLRRNWRNGLFVAVAIGLGAVFNSILKALYARARPDVVPHLTEVTSASFPSGHSMMASITYLTLGALLARASESHRERAYFIIVAVLLTVLVGFTRVFLGVHYPSDVLAGWSAGIAWALACSAVALWLQHRGELGKIQTKED
jgi:undecaprenyl-diphosphatase